MLAKSFIWESHVGWDTLTYPNNYDPRRAREAPLSVLPPTSRSSACHGLQCPVSIWNWECISYNRWMIRKKKKTQNEYFFRENNNNDLKPEYYIRKYYKFIKAQIISEKPLHLASPSIVSKHLHVYDFVHSWQANDNTNIFNTPQLFPKHRWFWQKNCNSCICCVLIHTPTLWDKTIIFLLLTLRLWKNKQIAQGHKVNKF